MCTPTYHERNLDNISRLAPNTKKVALEWYNWCVKNKIDILIYETIRTVEQQKQYVASGKSKTMQSYHLVGQALDWVPIVDGKPDWNAYSQRPFLTAIEQAEKLGFTSGYRWGWDAPHLQFQYKGYGTDKESENKTISKPGSSVKEQAKSEAIVPYPGKPLKVGSKGKDVERIQRALKIKVDGVFGKQTEAAVKAYQKRKGLVVDGIVGSQTWNMLF